MSKKLVLAAIFAIALPITSLAQATADKAQTTAKSTSDPKSQIQRWGTATLTMTDDQGKTVTKTEKYPIIDKATASTPTFKAATQDFNNCWDWCKRVCDGYGVCWLSCGTSCSPWWPK